MRKGLLSCLGLSLLLLAPLIAYGGSDRDRRHGHEQRWHSSERHQPRFHYRDLRRHDFRSPDRHFYAPYRAIPRSYYAPPRWHGPRHSWQGPRWHNDRPRHLQRPPAHRHRQAHRHGGRRH